MGLENNQEKTGEMENVSPLAKELLLSLEKKSGNKILQIGTGGEENDCEYFIENGNNVVLLSNNENSAVSLKEKKTQSDIDKKNFLVSEIEQLSLKNEQFDAAISIAGLDTTILQDSLNEIGRVLKPNGNFFMYLYEKVGDYKFRDPEEVKKEITNAGFVIEDSWNFTDERHTEKTKIMIFKLKKNAQTNNPQA